MGEVFAGRYELADPIGRGGVGAVWRAWDHRRRRYVAAKVLQQSDAHTLLRFVREQALRIDHPHVLAPASWAADDDKVLFTMDLVAGGSLAHLIGDYGPLPPPFVCVLLDQLLSGLSAVHAEGVVHRDIKPANILLEATGTGLPHLRVSDFGIAMRKGEPRLTETNYVVGTPGYFAPEQAMGAEPDFPADLFAAGLVALYLLEGAKPDAKALIEHFAEHGTPSAPVGVPGPLWGVLAGLLQPDPEARFRTATGARKALLAAAELLPEPGPEDDLIEVFDQLGPLPPGFGPSGPAVRGRRARPLHATGTTPVMPMPPHVPAYERETAGESQSRAEPYSGPQPGPHSERVPGPEPAAPFEPPPKPAAAPGPMREPEPNATPSHATPSHAAPSNATPSHPTPSHPTAGYPTAGRPAPPPTAEPSSESTPEPSLTSMSETGSFHLPPPAPAPTEERLPPPPAMPPMPSGQPSTAVPLPEPPRHQPPAAQPRPEPAREPLPAPPAPVSHDPSPPPRPAQAMTTVVPYGQDRHSVYASRSREVPHRARELSARRARRPGPPAKVTIPVLFIAVLCFAVGVWALTQA
ncbi:protein kinase [Streptomyces kunmingensis]|uniref:non-specific serine/threonine protein kinase n=1 Tax=Streptomyces kunmingensis TaxID=68225 RepID=A0ABU6CME7_9ACTN|nr:protein kinase [Streptomyces kunmingensis]MEB3965908.1 protein kinase [Streptomyces kunmingensis]